MGIGLELGDLDDCPNEEQDQDKGQDGCQNGHHGTVDPKVTHDDRGEPEAHDAKDDRGDHKDATKLQDGFQLIPRECQVAKVTYPCLLGSISALCRLRGLI